VRESVQEPRRPTPRHFNRVSLTLVGLVALAATALLIWLGQAEPARERTVATVASVPTNGKLKGDPSAPVLIEEWGDFQ
jgi:hypothetical protein